MSELDRIRILVMHLILKGVAENQKSLGTLMGYKTESAFSQVLTGKVKIPDDFISRLSSLDNSINSNWVKTGKGSMEKEGLQTTVSENETISLMAKSNSTLSEAIQDAIKTSRDAVQMASETSKALNNTMVANQEIMERILLLLEEREKKELPAVSAKLAVRQTGG